MPFGRIRRTLSLAISLAFPCVSLLAAGAARAQEPSGFGDRGQLAIDQISGFRLSSSGSITYYGPIGVSVSSITLRNLNTRANVTEDDTFHYTTFWLAPSADFFVIDHLSIGGLIEYAHTSTSEDVNVVGAPTQTVNLPSTTDFTLLPRVGYLIPIGGDRFGIWPRGGVGYVSRQVSTPAGANTFTADTFSGLTVDIDVGFLYRITDSFFIKAAPEIAFVPGATHSESLQNTNSISGPASAFQFALVSGVGGIIQL
jgi:hypothetical protein